MQTFFMYFALMHVCLAHDQKPTPEVSAMALEEY